MASRHDRILEGPPQTGVVVPWTGVPKGAPSGPRESQQRESSPCRSHADTPQRLRKVGQSPAPNLIPHLRRATGLSL